MKSADIWGHSLVAQVHKIAYIHHQVLSALWCIWLSQLCGIGDSCYKFVQWNCAVSPGAYHQPTRLATAFEMYCDCPRVEPNEIQQWMLYLASLGGFHSRNCQSTSQNQLLATYWLAFPYSSPSKPCLKISSNISHSTVTKSVGHYQDFPFAPISPKSPEDLHHQSPKAKFHLKTVSNCSAPV